MAGGKLSPRQKMINLMYLIFIAMLALNMSKEVLSAFGLMNAKLEKSNNSTTERNADFMAGLAAKVEEQRAKYKPLKDQADKITVLANDFNAYIEGLKGEMTKDQKDLQDYEVMDRSDYLDELFFVGGQLKPAGQEFKDEIATFRDGVVEVLADNPSLQDISKDVLEKFSTDTEKTRDGIEKEWLDYNYKGFPLIASLTKMTQLQADVKTTESEVLSSMLAGKLKIEASLTNFEAIVVPEKTAFFSGENFKGKIILGKKDVTLSADKVIINGIELPAESMQAGQTLLEFPAGAVGERNITGEFQFKEGDSIITIPVNSSYAVVPKPNSAVIAADKMNVVYRGLVNPMTISIPGIPDNLVSASGSGLRKGSGIGKYNMTPGGGREVKINATGTLSDGSKVSSSQTFRIKDIPKPLATVRKESGYVKMPKSSLVKTTVGVGLPDFLFDLKFSVNSFKVKAPGTATIVVNGSSMNSQAQAAINKARSGDIIAIFDVKSSIQGVSGISVKDASAVSVEIQ
jgi:gliding motility-associated protein GldM